MKATIARILRWLALNGDVLRRTADRLDPQGGGGPPPVLK